MSNNIFLGFEAPGFVSLTDFEAMQKMLSLRSIPFEVDGPPHTADGFRSITIEGGYAGFYTVMTFNEEGMLADIAAYE
jgi:hypothetical protein